jgi:hypothetical protein
LIRQKRKNFWMPLSEAYALQPLRAHFQPGGEASLFYLVLIIDPAEGGSFSEDGNPVIQDNFWIPARRPAVAGMTNDEIYAGVIFESPQP